MADAVGATPSRLSFHLWALATAGLVTSSRHARHVVYRADLEAAAGLLDYLLNECCGGHPKVAACCRPRGVS